MTGKAPRSRVKLRRMLPALPPQPVTTLMGDVPPIYRQWVSQVRYQPKGKVIISFGDKADPHTDAGAAMYANPDGSATLKFKAGNVDRSEFFHELGHAYDQQNLNDLARQRFRGIMRDPRPYEAQGGSASGPPNSPSEIFADAYSLLASHPWAAQNKRQFQRLINFQQGARNPYTENGYQIRRVDLGHGGKATYFQLRKILRLIQGQS